MKPNVIIVLSDDQGYGDIGAFGNPLVETPHLDRLAAEGVALTQHYSGSPLCAPARASLLTGCYNHRVGALSVESNSGLDRISTSVPTIADPFRNAGYRTGMVGKWHNGVFDRRYHPLSRGFDEFLGFRNGGMGYFDWILEANDMPLRADGRYLTDVFTDAAVDFIRRSAGSPFLLYLAYNAPHDPIEAPEEDVAPFRDTGRFTDTVATLYGMVRRMDVGIGRLLATLDKEGLADNTIVLFASDNGPWLADQYARHNGPFRGQKQDVLEGGIRVPAIVRWPAGLTAGDRVDAMIHFTDWLPTLAACTGISLLEPAALDGISVLPALHGEPSPITQRFWQYNRYEPVRACNGAMRDGVWKLVLPRIPEAMQKLPEDNVWYRRMFSEIPGDMSVTNPCITRSLSAPGSPMLYNLEEDPSESHDLAATHPQRLHHMRTDYETWFDRVELDRRSLPDRA